ncbi:ANTAR domain-containing protein [Streptomyces sp. NBC_00989]|uniref:ANTAR domain-containing protein n=1 Tax=Streptomyces sp. NBC_00989 TaxID=2903705 RepID=UPI003864C4A9|nr:ANTAR domain-containing protein [Streptomyces sp. NBC_00989]
MHHTTREGRLAAALVEAADTLTEDFDTEEYLRRLADHCVELLSAWAAGIVLIDGGEAVALAGSRRGGREEVALDLLAAQHNSGPCLESYGSGRPVPPVSINAAHTAARWPEFTERALRHGVVATFAVPVRRHETPLGALNVFVPALPDRASDGGGSEVSVAQGLADAAALGLENQRAYAQSRSLAGQLQEALSSRVRIEQAKGMLAERWHIGTDEAFIALRGHARRRRLPLDRVARAVIEGGLVDRL